MNYMRDNNLIFKYVTISEKKSYKMRVVVGFVSSPTFILLFFLYDQLCCLYCNYVTPAKHFTLRDTLVHAVWGFLNTKTYTLVVLLHMMNASVTIPIWLWALDAYFKVGQQS